MNEIMSYYRNKTNELPQPTTKANINSSNASSKLFTSKIHKFENLPEPKNATEGNVIFNNYELFIIYNFFLPSLII
jgi:hypothetical protein